MHAVATPLPHGNLANTPKKCKKKAEKVQKRLAIGPLARFEKADTNDNFPIRSPSPAESQGGLMKTIAKTALRAMNIKPKALRFCFPLPLGEG